jgi:hypothetical protein
LCDDASVTISVRTSSGGGATSQSGTLSYTLNGGSSVVISSSINSNLGTTYVGFSNIPCNYGDVLVFSFVQNVGNSNNWGQGFNGSYSNLNDWQCGSPNTYTYTVTSTGLNNLYFNISSQNTVWNSVPPC